jgi:hypothetical protein
MQMLECVINRFSGVSYGIFYNVGKRVLQIQSIIFIPAGKPYKY